MTYDVCDVFLSQLSVNSTHWHCEASQAFFDTSVLFTIKQTLLSWSGQVRDNCTQDFIRSTIWLFKPPNEPCNPF